MRINNNNEVIYNFGGATRHLALQNSHHQVKKYSSMLCAFFWVIPRRLNFICRRFGTHYLSHLHRQVGVCPQPRSFCTHLPAYEDGTVCSETSAYKIQTPGNYPEESIQHSKKGPSLKSISSKFIDIFDTCPQNCSTALP